MHHLISIRIEHWIDIVSIMGNYSHSTCKQFWWKNGKCNNFLRTKWRKAPPSELHLSNIELKNIYNDMKRKKLLSTHAQWYRSLPSM